MDLLKKIARGLLKVENWRLYELPIRPLQESSDTSPGVLWKPGSEEDIFLLTLEAHNYNDWRRREAQRALKDGDRFLLGEIDGKIAHVVWWTAGNIVIGERSIPMGLGSVYVFNGRTADEFAGRRLQRSGLRQVANAANRDHPETTRLLAFVDETVQPAIKNFENEQARLIGRVKVYRFLRKWHRVQLDPGVESNIRADSR